MLFLAVSLLLGGFLNISWKPCRTLPVLDTTYLQLNHVNIQPTDALSLSLVDGITLVSGRKNTSPFQMRLSFLECPLLLFLEQKKNEYWLARPLLMGFHITNTLDLSLGSHYTCEHTQECPCAHTESGTSSETEPLLHIACILWPCIPSKLSFTGKGIRPSEGST